MGTGSASHLDLETQFLRVPGAIPKKADACSTVQYGDGSTDVVDDMLLVLDDFKPLLRRQVLRRKGQLK